MKPHFSLGETSDYKKFNWRDSNREINDKNVKKLVKDIQERGLQSPIVVNENYEIIDGQHRFVALRQLGMVIHYIISRKWRDDEDIAAMQVATKWSAWDYCYNRSKRGDLACKAAIEAADELFKHSQKKMSRIRTIELIMAGRSSTGLLSKLKKGEFSINESCLETVYEAILLMTEHPMGTSPYGARITRVLKYLFYDYGLDLEILENMVQNNYIQAYASETDQYNYMHDMYIKSAKNLKKNIKQES